MTGAVVLALRRVLAAVVLIGGTLLAIDIGTYTSRWEVPSCGGPGPCPFELTHPVWAIAVGVVVGLASVVVAVLLFAPRLQAFGR